MIKRIIEFSATNRVLVLMAVAALCVLAWLGTGSFLPGRAFGGSVLFEAAGRAALGAAALSVLTFVLGLAGVFQQWLLIALTGVLAVPGARQGRRLVRRVELPRGPARWLLAPTGLALLLGLVGAAAPPTSADALRYHLGAPRWWLELGRIDLGLGPQTCHP